MKLTEQQRKAVAIKDGNVLVNASFGSGKTASFVARIAYLISNHKVHPENILGLTFTRDASESMRIKLAKTIGDLASTKVTLTTFHSFAYKELRSRYSEYSNIKIVEPWFELQLANDIVGKSSSSNSDGHDLRINGGAFLDFVSYQKANIVDMGDPIVIDNRTAYVEHINKSTLQSAFDTYCKRMKNARKMSFDDMLLDFYIKLSEDDDLLSKLKGRYKYIMVDEFQDTSYINLEIIKLLSSGNVYAVGDVNQSIYSFQNAQVGNILSFKDTFDDVNVIAFPHNFRSTQNIINLSNDILDYRGKDDPLNQFGKQICGREIEGDKVGIAVYNDEIRESHYIVNDIMDRMAKNPHLSYSDFCIISRTNNGLLTFENELSSEGIPVIISSGGSFYDRKEIDDLLSYATLSVMADDDAMRKIANRPNRFISNAIIRELEEYAFNKQINMEDALDDGFDAGRYRSGLNRLIYTIEDIREATANKGAEGTLREIYKLTNYYNFIQEKATTNSEVYIKTDAINRLYETARPFKSIESFLAYVKGVKANAKKENDGVVLSTAHSSKGLEWDTVYVVGLSDSNYPHEMLIDENKDEELRLLFVAIGRAKNTLQLSLPVFKGKGEEVYEPSRFIVDMFGEDLQKAYNNVLSGKEVVKFDYKPIVRR